MARQFKASTFFNKTMPSYYVRYMIEKKQYYHYSYEFNDGTVEQAVSDFCESRMLVSIYALISVYEQKIIVPSGKFVNLADFDKKSWFFIRNVSDFLFSNYENLTSPRPMKDKLGFTSVYLKDDITHDEFLNTNFYNDHFLKNEIAFKAFAISSFFYKSNNNIVDFILNFNLDNLSRFKELSTRFDIFPQSNEAERDSVLPDERVTNVIESEFDEDLDTLPELAYVADIHFSDDLTDAKNALLNNVNTINPVKLKYPIGRQMKKEPNISIDDDNFQYFMRYSEEIMQDPLKLELFKILDQASKTITRLRNYFDKVLEKLTDTTPVKTEYDLNKENYVNKFIEHHSIYSESKIRVDTKIKINEHYDLVDGIKIFSNYPYSSRQYENQAYMPFMIKAPIKKVTQSMIDDIQNMINDFPHFHEVINYIALSLKIKLNTTGILSFKHILIVGNHGIGKNAFVSRLNSVLGYVGNTINMTSIMAPFELSGMDAGWNGAAPGFIFKSIVKNNAANSVLILDDMDNVNNTHNGNVNMPINELLEPSIAKSYYENFFQTNIDMSHISVIGLAKNIETVDKGSLNLFKVFTIETPDVSAISSIAFSIYNEFIVDPIYSFITVESHEINELVAKFIMRKVFSPRSMKKVIEDLLNDKLIETVNKKDQLSNEDNHKEEYSNELFSKKDK